MGVSFRRTSSAPFIGSSTGTHLLLAGFHLQRTVNTLYHGESDGFERCYFTVGKDERLHTFAEVRQVSLCQDYATQPKLTLHPQGESLPGPSLLAESLLRSAQVCLSTFLPLLPHPHLIR